MKTNYFIGLYFIFYLHYLIKFINIEVAECMIYDLRRENYICFKEENNIKTICQKEVGYFVEKNYGGLINHTINITNNYYLNLTTVA